MINDLAQEFPEDVPQKSWGTIGARRFGVVDEMASPRPYRRRRDPDANRETWLSHTWLSHCDDIRVRISLLFGIAPVASRIAESFDAACGIFQTPRIGCASS